MTDDTDGDVYSMSFDELLDLENSDFTTVPPTVSTATTSNPPEKGADDE